MKENKFDDRQTCIQKCEEKYHDCNRKTLTGCVEVLRVCKDKCPIDHR